MQEDEYRRAIEDAAGAGHRRRRILIPSSRIQARSYPDLSA